jgi:hypothetical protein
MHILHNYLTIKQIKFSTIIEQGQNKYFPTMQQPSKNNIPESPTRPDKPTGIHLSEHNKSKRSH